VDVDLSDPNTRWKGASPNQIKAILEVLLLAAKEEKPSITRNNVRRFVMSKYPNWSKNRIADMGERLYMMIVSLPNVEKPAGQ
jgi:hypothetical protein